MTVLEQPGVLPTTGPAPVLSGPWGAASVVGVGAVLPAHGVPDARALLAPGPAVPFDPVASLGRRGVRYKDRATLQAAAAAAEALASAGTDTSSPSRDVGLVVASCYGNLETVCDSARTIDREGVPGLSPMALPNASSNVVASEISIRHRLQGVVLTVCNGHTSGWDALRWAVELLRSGRCASVLVVGVETPSPPEQSLRRGGAPLVDGAVAVVLTGLRQQPTPDRSVSPAAERSAAERTDVRDAEAAALPGHELAAVAGILSVAMATVRPVVGEPALVCGGRPGWDDWVVQR